jgi:hypothetical protein
VRGMTLDEMAQQVPLIRFRSLTLITAGELIRSGLRLEPTGRIRSTTQLALTTWVRA